MTVYIVTDGEYSSYSICGVYSSREKAERAKLLYAASNNIEEHELDELPESPAGMLSYKVYMSVDGERVDIDQQSVTYTPEGPWIPDNWHTKRDGCETAIFEMWAMDEEHAVKIANEWRIAALASGEWREQFDKWFNPSLREPGWEVPRRKIG